MHLLCFLTIVTAIPHKGPRIDPVHATNITVYHVNPHAAGAIPLNMDTGNVW